MATAMALIGTAVSAVGSIATGMAQKQAADYEAQEYRVKANEDEAVGQRNAQAVDLKKQLAESTLQADAAGEGLSGTDTGTLNLEKGIEGYGDVQAGTELYKGESQKAGDIAAADSDVATGKADLTGSFFNAGGTLLSGFSSTMFDAYGAGLLPKPGAAPTSAYGAMSAVYG